MPADGEAVERATQSHGRALLTALRAQAHHSVTDRVYDWLLRLVTADERLKLDLFRFVDVLPALHGPHAVARHLEEYLGERGLDLPSGVARLARLMARTAPGEWVMSEAAQAGTHLLAQRFIAGADARQVLRAARHLRRSDLAFSADLLGEAVTSEEEAELYQQRYLALLRDLAAADLWPPNPVTDQAPFGPLPRVNLSIKLSSLYARFDPVAADSSVAAVKARLRPILTLARERGAFVHVDMEQYALRDLTQRVFTEILSEDDFRDWTDTGIVIQAYLRDARDSLRDLVHWAEHRGTPVWVRLVKGAYWDYETIVAAQHGWPVPVYAHKAETDASFERLSAILVEHWQVLRPAIATHNVRSAAHAQALAEHFGLPLRAVEFQVLCGMGHPIGRALAAAGERVRVYLPCGELLPGIAYLVRRLLENSSNESFVRHIELDEVQDEALLAAPASATPPADSLSPRERAGVRAPVAARAPDQALSPTLSRGERGPEPDWPGSCAPPASAFVNEPLTNFALAEARQAFATALEQVRGRLGESVPIVIAGRREESPELVERADPSHTARIASRSYLATVEQAERAVAPAHAAFPAWRDTPAGERAAVLRRAAADLRRRRFEIAAWEVYEVGKPWRDADADVAEAVDYCEYYAAEMERLAAPRRRDVPGEWNDYRYDGRGPAVVIAPWNFPLAILTGMSTAALVAGNTVVMKPAEQSARVGWFLMEALEAAGLPPGVAGFVPGAGEVVGPALVNDPRVALVAFTGSRAVGLSILRDAAHVAPGQREIRRVIAELGGKNAIVVDQDADLDEAVPGVCASAFGYAGQKCSACARVITVGAIHEPFCARLAAAVRSLALGPAEDAATTLGPLVDAEARERVTGYLARGLDEGRLLVEVRPSAELAARGHYVPAAVFTEVDPGGRLWQEEVFGPLLCVRQASDFEAALAMAGDSPYALTGGCYSRSPANLERARRELRVGNLYLNRGITGALVDRQPFGGAGLSGIGSKAGGPDYLLQFLVPRTVTEAVLRRGFAPDPRGAESPDR